MGANLNIHYLINVIIAIILSLVVHEFMHAYAGHLLGDSTAKEEGRLSLNPLNHIDPFMTVVLPIVTLVIAGFPVLAAKPVPFNPENVKYDEFGPAIIAAAGPLSNIVLAVIAALIANHLQLGYTIGYFLTVFVSLNVMLFVFNLVPIPPLDGSRVLYAFAPEAVQRFMMTIEPFGLMIVFGLVFITGLGGMLANINSYIISVLANI